MNNKFKKLIIFLILKILIQKNLIIFKYNHDFKQKKTNSSK